MLQFYSWTYIFLKYILQQNITMVISILILLFSNNNIIYYNIVILIYNHKILPNRAALQTKKTFLNHNLSQKNHNENFPQIMQSPIITWFFFFSLRVSRCPCSEVPQQLEKELLNWLKLGLKRHSQRSGSTGDEVEWFWSELSTLLSDGTDKLLFIHRLF